MGLLIFSDHFPLFSFGIIIFTIAITHRFTLYIVSDYFYTFIPISLGTHPCNFILIFL